MTTKLTALETEMICTIVNNEYSADESEQGTWAFVICENRSGAAVFGSLVKKGLAESYRHDADMWCELTDLGEQMYTKITGA